MKTFGGSVPPEALAAGRVVVEFTDKSQPSQLPDMSRYRQGSVIKSVTGQLAWDTSDKGFFTVNTAGTKAVVGFTGGKEQTLGDVKVRLDTPFASLFLTALEPGEDLASGKRALITVLARREQHRLHLLRARRPGPEERRAAHPAGAGEGDGDHRGPAALRAVNVLDHDGRRTGRTLAVTDGQFTLDGAKDKAIYYEVVFR